MCDATWSPLITGQKGIGFKSVFKVTDRPEIHSNGFHLRFDKTCGPMGYILPHWGEDEKPLDTQLTDINQHRWDSCRYTNNINGGFVQVSHDSVTMSLDILWTKLLIVKLISRLSDNEIIFSSQAPPACHKLCLSVTCC